MLDTHALLDESGNLLLDESGAGVLYDESYVLLTIVPKYTVRVDLQNRKVYVSESIGDTNTYIDRQSRVILVDESIGNTTVYVDSETRTVYIL